MNNAFIKGLGNVHGVAVDSTHVYWTQGSGATSSIGRANLDGSGANANFIPNSAGLNFAAASPQAAIAVNTNGVYWANTGTTTIGRANIDGSAPNSTLINVPGSRICGIAASDSFVYWLNNGDRAPDRPSGRRRLEPDPELHQRCDRQLRPGGQRLIPLLRRGKSCDRSCAPRRRASPATASFPSATSAANTPCGVAVNSQYVFWGNDGVDRLRRAREPGRRGLESEPGLRADRPLPARGGALQQDHRQVRDAQEEEGHGDHQRKGPRDRARRGSRTPRHPRRRARRR